MVSSQKTSGSVRNLRVRCCNGWRANIRPYVVGVAPCPVVVPRVNLVTYSLGVKVCVVVVYDRLVASNSKSMPAITFDVTSAPTVPVLPMNV